MAITGRVTSNQPAALKQCPSGVTSPAALWHSRVHPLSASLWQCFSAAGWLDVTLPVIGQMAFTG